MFAILIHHYNQPAEINPEIFTNRGLAETIANNIANQVREDEMMRGEMFPRSYTEVIEVRMA